MGCCGGWREEFAGRGVDYDVPESIIRMEGLEDMSWHNDACPSFGTYISDELDLRIWCEAPNPADRESGMDHRFAINAGVWSDEAWEWLRAAGLPHLTGEFPAPDLGDTEPAMCQFETDDPVEAVKIFLFVLVRLQAAKAAA